MSSYDTSPSIPVLMSEYPEEVLALIFSFLRPQLNVQHGFGIIESGGYPVDAKVQRNALATICCASKACYRLASPLLYHTIQLQDGGPQIKPLMRTLLRKPELAKEIVELRVGTWEKAEDGQPELRIDPTADSGIATSAETITQSFHMSPELEKNVLSDLGYGGEDGALTILLAISANLEVLDMAAVYQLRGTLVMRFIEDVLGKGLPNSHGYGLQDSNSTQVPPLSRLREFRADHWDTEGATVLAKLWPALRLPSVHTFRGQMISCEHDNCEQIPTDTGRMTNLKNVHLSASILDAEGIARILRACPALRLLSVQWGHSTVGYCEIQFDQIADYLNRYGNELRRLTLDVQQDSCFDASDEPFYRPFGRLRDMNNLQQLNVPEVGLFGLDDEEDEGYPNFAEPMLVETLPLSLERLKIVECNGDEEKLDSQLVHLMSDPRFTKLKAIRVNRGKRFTRDARQLGWDDSKSNRFWVVLLRETSPAILLSTSDSG